MKIEINFAETVTYVKELDLAQFNTGKIETYIQEKYDLTTITEEKIVKLFVLPVAIQTILPPDVLVIKKNHKLLRPLRSLKHSSSETIPFSSRQVSSSRFHCKSF